MHNPLVAALSCWLRRWGWSVWHKFVGVYIISLCMLMVWLNRQFYLSDTSRNNVGNVFLSCRRSFSGLQRLPFFSFYYTQLPDKQWVQIQMMKTHLFCVYEKKITKKPLFGSSFQFRLNCTQSWMLFLRTPHLDVSKYLGYRAPIQTAENSCCKYKGLIV